MLTAPTNRTATAVMETPFGCGVRFEGKKAFVERDRARVQGIVRRTANRPAALPGEQLTVTTDGSLLAEIVPGRPGWEEVRKGSLVDAKN